jgi:hypothetical protein
MSDARGLESIAREPEPITNFHSISGHSYIENTLLTMVIRYHLVDFSRRR